MKRISLAIFAFLSSSQVCAVEPQEAIDRLAAMRMKALTALPADRREIRLSLGQAADQDDAEVTLHQVGGAWSGGQIVVPGWGPSVMTEWRRFFHCNGTWNGGIRHAVDASALRLEGDHLSGDIVATYLYDSPKAERIPAGMGANYWDHFVATGHTVPRKVVHHLEATLVPEAWLAEIVLEDGVTWPNTPRKGAPKRSSKGTTPPTAIETAPEPTRSHIVIRLRLPCSPTMPVQVKGWNGGWHEADASGLKLEGQTLSGTLIGYYHQDGWMPWGGGKTWQAAPSGVTYRITARLVGGTLSGDYDAVGIPNTATGSSQSFGVESYTNPMKSWKGRILGRVGRLLIGRHSTNGDLGQRAGEVLGSISLDGGLPPVPTGITTAEGFAAAGESLLSDLRALAMAQQTPGLPLERARIQTDVLRTDWTGADMATVGAWLQRALSWYEQGPFQLPTAIAEVSGDSPSLGTSACDGEVPTKGWHHVATWKLAGPIQQRSGYEQDSCPLAEVVPADRPLLQEYDSNGCRVQKAAATIWGEIKPLGMTVMLPEKYAPMHVRYQNTLFFGTAKFRLANAGAVRFALDAAEPTQVFVDGRLVWLMPERAWRVRRSGRQIVRLELGAGEHQLLIRSHFGRHAPWVQCALSCEAAQAGMATAPSPTPANEDAGDPPVVWDLARDTAWRITDLAGSMRPLALGGTLYVSSPARITAVNPVDGTIKWNTVIGEGGGSEKPGPIAWDTDIIAGNRSQGLVARLAPDGKVLWRTPLQLSVGVLHRVGDKLIAEGPLLPDWKDSNSKFDITKEKALIGVVSLDPINGAVLARWTLRGGPGAGAQGAGTLASAGFDEDLTASIRVQGKDRLYATYLSSANVLIDVLDGGGTRLLDVDWPGQYDDGLARAQTGVYARATVAALGSDLVLASQAGVTVIGFWPGPDGRLAFGPRWAANGLTSGHGGFPAKAALDAERVYVWNVIASHGPHCPDAFVECTAYDRATGKILKNQKRLHPGLARGGKAWVQAGRLYICEPGAEPFVNATVGHITVVSADANLNILGAGDLDPRSKEPLAIGGQVIVRSPKGLYAIRRHADHAIAAAQGLLDRLGSQPEDTKAPLLPALTKIPTGTDLPVTVFISGMAPTRWLGYGPVANLPDDPASLLPGSSAAPAWRSLTRSEAWRDPPMYHRQNELQGTGDIVPVFSAHLDPAACAGEKGSGLFYSLLDCGQEKMIVSRLAGPGLTLWVSGHRAQPSETLRLAPGLHPVVIRVDPPWFAQKMVVPLQPVDVAKGLTSGQLQSMWKGQWKVAGPISVDVPPLDGTRLAEMPGKEMVIGQTVVRVHEVSDPEHRLRLTSLVDLAPDQAFDPVHQPAEIIIGHPVSAYAFMEITTPAAGVLYFTASVDWHMKWYLDGKQIYSTATAGNGGNTEEIGLHPFAASVTAGRHVVCVEIKPGSKGFQLRADIAFTDQTVEKLTGIQVPSKIQPQPIDLRLDPACTEVPLPSARQAVWLKKAQAMKGELEKILKDLPGTPQAARAEKILAMIR